MKYRVSFVIEKDRYGYYAFSPEIEGCRTEGNSLEEVIEQMRKSVAQYLERSIAGPLGQPV